MTWRGKFKVWTPQIIETSVLTLVAVVTSIGKISGIDRHGWDHYLTGGCNGCQKWKAYTDKLTGQHQAKLDTITQERDKLAQALLTEGN